MNRRYDVLFLVLALVPTLASFMGTVFIESEGRNFLEGRIQSSSRRILAYTSVNELQCNAAVHGLRLLMCLQVTCVTNALSFVSRKKSYIRTRLTSVYIGCLSSID